MLFRSCLVIILMSGMVPQSLARDPVDSKSPGRICIVVGAAGESEYGERFASWARALDNSLGEITRKKIGFIEGAALETLPQESDRKQLADWISETEKVESGEERWIIFFGHGTHDGKSSKMNLRGEDVSASELRDLLAKSTHRWVIVICSACSAPFLNELSGADRIVITATKSANESNFSRFGESFSSAFSDLEADLDHDGAISLLEAFLVSSRKTERYYAEKRLLATEHAMIDDNGDKKGTGAEFYNGLRIARRSEGGELDGMRAGQLWLIPPRNRLDLTQKAMERVEELEAQVRSIRGDKKGMTEDEYYRKLEILLTEIAHLLYAGKE